MQVERLGNLHAHGQRRVQRRHRLLEDHGDGVAAHGAHGGIVELEEVLPVEDHLAAFDAAGRRGDQAHDGQRGHALARPRLADDGDGLARIDVERDLVDRGEPPALRVEARRQIADLQEGLRQAGEPAHRRV